MIVVAASLLPIVPSLHAIELKGANGRTLDFSGIREARPDGLVLRTSAEAREVTVPWSSFDLEAMKSAQPEIHDAYGKVATADTAMAIVPLRLGDYAPQPLSIDLTQHSSRVTPHEPEGGGRSRPYFEQLTPYNFTDRDGWQMKLRLYVPGTASSGEKLPLAIYLHGTGGAGTDNAKHIPALDGGLLFIKEENQEKFPCLVMVPQCPPGEAWSWGPLNPDTDAGDRLTDFLKELVKNLPVLDGERIYITGYSQGGFAALRLAMEYPDFYAAVAPMAGAASGDEFRGVKWLPPVWLFYNEDDKQHVEWFKQAHAELDRMGSIHRVTVYPTGGHGGTMKAYQEPELLPWLFSHGTGR